MPWKPPLELHDLVAAAICARNTHREGVRFRARRHESDLLRAGHRIDQFGRQPDAVFVVGEEGEAAPKLFL